VGPDSAIIPGKNDGQARRLNRRLGKGINPGTLVNVIDVKWLGSSMVERTYKDAAGRAEITRLTREGTAPSTKQPQRIEQP
jgi:hypothetical protein